MATLIEQTKQYPDNAATRNVVITKKGSISMLEINSGIHQDLKDNQFFQDRDYRSRTRKDIGDAENEAYRLSYATGRIIGSLRIRDTCVSLALIKKVAEMARKNLTTEEEWRYQGITEEGDPFMVEINVPSPFINQGGQN